MIYGWQRIPFWVGLLGGFVWFCPTCQEAMIGAIPDLRATFEGSEELKETSCRGCRSCDPTSGKICGIRPGYGGSELGIFPGWIYFIGIKICAVCSPKILDVLPEFRARVAEYLGPGYQKATEDDRTERPGKTV